jgi:hypothetical protein
MVRILGHDRTGWSRPLKLEVTYIVKTVEIPTPDLYCVKYLMIYRS